MRLSAVCTVNGQLLFDKITDGMGVTIELENLGDAQLCQDIRVHIEHALSQRRGDWRISITGSRAAENWDLRIEGPQGFERSYTLSSATGEHEPAAIRALVLKLVPGVIRKEPVVIRSHPRPRNC